MTTRAKDGLDLLRVDDQAAPPDDQAAPPDLPEQPTPAQTCQPDQWDANGRLVSNDRNNPI